MNAMQRGLPPLSTSLLLLSSLEPHTHTHTHTHSGAVLASMVSKITILFMLILFLFPNMLFDRHPRSERHDKCFCSSGLVFAQYAKNVPLRSKWKIMSYPNTEFNLVVPYELRI